jgi:hypothetical protein
LVGVLAAETQKGRGAQVGSRGLEEVSPFDLSIKAVPLEADGPA